MKISPAPPPPPPAASSSSSSSSQESTHPAPSCCSTDFRLRFYKMESNMVRFAGHFLCDWGIPNCPWVGPEGMWCFGLLPWMALSENRLPLNPLGNHHPFKPMENPLLSDPNGDTRSDQLKQLVFVLAGHVRLAGDDASNLIVFWVQSWKQPVNGRRYWSFYWAELKLQ